jgi:hypothetical protein
MPLKKVKKISVLILCIFLLVSQLGAAGYEARLENIVITNTRDDLLIFMNVEGAFTDKMKNAVLSGVPITFSFFFHLYQVRNVWLDKKIAALKITQTLKYDSLKKEFIILRSWGDEKFLTADSLEEAQKLMTDIEGVKICDIRELNKGRQYQVRAKAELSRKTLPFYLHYVLFFMSLWDFETDWYTIDFIY